MNSQQQIFSQTYPNGLTLVAQPMQWLESAAVSIAVGAGCRFDPVSKLGLANIVDEMVQRGCGDFDSRQFLETMEGLGIDFGSNVSTYNANFSGAMPWKQLPDSLNVFADLVLRPHLPEEQLDDAVSVCMQEIQGLEDDLSQKVMLELRRRHYGQPDGNHAEGTIETLSSISMTDIQSYYRQHFVPNKTIIGCAGKLDWEKLKERVGELFGGWKRGELSEPPAVPGEHGQIHIPFDSEQTHIAVGYSAVPYAHPDYYLCRGAIGVLSGGLSSRLFHEIREKRGLCYSVFANCHSLKDRGAVFAYSGTSTERAQETLDVLLHELRSLYSGINEDELRRLKIQIRTSLVGQQESCRSRAHSLASDWLHLGTAQTLSEVNRKIEELTVSSINDFLERSVPASYDIVTLGAQPLEFRNHEIS